MSHVFGCGLREWGTDPVSPLYVKSFHAIYLEPGTGRIYCDLVVDYALRDWGSLKSEFLDYMRSAFPENEVVLTIETEFV